MASGGVANHCRDCGLYFESARSLDVHLQYHKENLLTRWAQQQQQEPASHSSIDKKSSPAPGRGSTPVSSLPSSPSPQMFASYPSQYSSSDTSGVTEYPHEVTDSSKIRPESPCYQGYPPAHGQGPGPPPLQYFGYSNYGVSTESAYDHYGVSRLQYPTPRYHPYNGSSHIPHPTAQDAWIAQQTYGNSNHCAKCEYVGTSPRDLLEHIKLVHPSTQVLYYDDANPHPPSSSVTGPSPQHHHHHNHQQQQQQPQGKENSQEPAEILDLDSHKVHVYQSPEKQRHSGFLPPELCHQWENETKSPGFYLPAQQQPSDFILPQSGSNSYMTSTPVSASNTPASALIPPPHQVPSSSPREPWKADAKRPKTYNCPACNKWFTSSGHLKRHYNTTLHKNAVKQNGGIDPAHQGNSSSPTPPSPATSLGDDSSRSGDACTPTPTYLPSSPVCPPSRGPPEIVSGGLLSPASPQQQHNHQLGTNNNSSITTINNNNSSNNNNNHLQLQQRSNRLPCYPINGTITPPNLLTHSNGVFGNMAAPLRNGSDSFTVMSSHGAPLPDIGTFSSIFPCYRNPTPLYMMQNGNVADSLLMNTPASQSEVEDDYSPTSSELEMAEDSSTVGSNGNLGTTITGEEMGAGGLPKCVECDKVFNKTCYLTQHNKSFHGGDKPFKCGTCGKRFPADYLYQEHLGKHAGDKPYKCELCPKQFNHKTDLRRHMCLHTGEKPYVCEVCGKGFIRKDHMLKHCETHRRQKVPAAV